MVAPDPAEGCRTGRYVARHVPLRRRSVSGLRTRLTRAAAGLVPAGVVQRAALARDRAGSVSVVVVVTDDNAPFLDDCLDRLNRQSRRPAEVLLAVVGTSRSTGDEVARQQRTSKRLRALARPGATGAAAMNEGARCARGRWLVWSDAGDRPADGALADLVDRALAEDADVVGSSLRDLGRVEIGDLLVERATWRRSGLAVPDAPHGSWWVAARLVLGARRVAPGRPLREGDRRGTGVSFGTMPLLAPTAALWWRDVTGLLDGLDALDDAPDAQERFHRWLLDQELPAYLEDAERCTDAQWVVLRTAAARLLDQAAPGDVAGLHVEPRVRAWLAAADERDVLAAYNAERWLEAGQFPVEVRQGVARAVLPLAADLVPEHVLRLGEADTGLSLLLRQMDRQDGQVRILVFAFIRRIGHEAGAISSSFWLVSPEGHRSVLSAEPSRDPEVNVVAGDRFADHASAAYTLVLDATMLPHGAPAGAPWRLEAEVEVAGLRRRGVVDVGLPAGADTTGDPTWSLAEVRVEDDDLVVRGATGSGASGAALRLSGPVATASADAVVDGAGFESRIRLHDDPWGSGSRPLPAGTYRLRLDRVDRAESPVLVCGRVTSSPGSSSSHRVRVHRGREGACLVTLAAPLADDEVGAFAQQGLRRWYASDEHRVDPSAVLLQSYVGQSTTDSPLAIHHALLRLRPDLRLSWTVADRSTPVPTGGRPVLLRSREWYAALASSGHLVTNTDMDPWFVKRPGQRLLQCFHGYPAKTMGIGAWHAKNFTPLRIERQLRRTSGTWDLLLTPTPAMDVHYREQYRYDGPILAAGYPRDDALVGPDVARVRSLTRERLGILPGQRAVLFAPTWRDDLATNFRAAAMSSTFDAAWAARELGDDVVLLLRGHRFHRRRGDAGAGLLDVTDYPEVNDLILAADAALLDYSSMRFDFALTRRPMVFLVPDLDRYTSGVRGFLFDFRSSAPGPLVSDTSEVVDQLRDLDALSRRWAPELDRFNAEFNALQDGHAAERVVRAFFGQETSATARR